MVVMTAIMPQPPDPTRTDLCAVVLAAGEGRRLWPLTLERPKPLCPVADVPLLDHALARVRSVTPHVAVNVHHGRVAIEEHLARAAGGPHPVHVSVEEHEALGTAGALGHLRGWIDGRATLVVNGDTWAPGPLAGIVAGWDGESVRVAVVGEDRLRPTSQVVATLLPWRVVEPLEAVPSGLYEVVWRPLAASGSLDVIRGAGPALDCGTPARYLAANMAATGGASVVGDGSVVGGALERSVLWPGGVVDPGERLVDAVRTTGGLTVLVR
jgi:NDP-sugar pyrophosphorylase family protein